LLQHLSTLSLSEWVCIGDFNEIFDNSHKVGGAWRHKVQMERFRSTIQFCQLGDLGFRGSKYTWSNKRKARGFILGSLDRAMATTSWCGHFPDMGGGPSRMQFRSYAHMLTFANLSSANSQDTFLQIRGLLGYRY
jgi:cation diffusion facilitator CzcD-associated flavoprotein CzcO